ERPLAPLVSDAWGRQTRVPDGGVRRTFRAHLRWGARKTSYWVGSSRALSHGAGPAVRFADAYRKNKQQRVPTTDAIDVASEIRCARRPSVVAGSRKTSAE